MDTLLAIGVVMLGLAAAASGARSFRDPRWIARERTTLLDKVLGWMTPFPPHGTTIRRTPFARGGTFDANTLSDRWIRTTGMLQVCVGLFFAGAGTVMLFS